MTYGQYRIERWHDDGGNSIFAASDSRAEIQGEWKALRERLADRQQAESIRASGVSYYLLKSGRLREPLARQNVPDPIQLGCEARIDDATRGAIDLTLEGIVSTDQQAMSLKRAKATRGKLLEQGWQIVGWSLEGQHGAELTFEHAGYPNLSIYLTFTR